MTQFLTLRTILFAKLILLIHVLNSQGQPLNESTIDHNQFALYEPIPDLPGRIFFTPPSLDCQHKGLDAMSPWLIDWMRRLVVFTFGGIALWPIHQFLFIGIKQFNRFMLLSGLTWLKVFTYSGIMLVCIGRCMCYAFDPFSYTGKLPIYVSRYNNMGIVTTLFSIYSLFLLIWLRSITHPHHHRCHKNTEANTTMPTLSTHCSQQVDTNKLDCSISSSNLARHWFTCFKPSRKSPNHKNKHALILYLRAVWGCLFVNAIMWTLELSFLFFLTQKQVAVVKSYFALGSMGVLILVMAMIVLGVNHITVKFVECQPPPVHLDDILIVSYKPGQTAILDVTLRPQFQPLQPLPTRITRALTGLMLISSVFRLVAGNSAMYPPGTVDIWLAVQAIMHVMEASILVLVLFGLIITPDSDVVHTNPDLPLSPIQQAFKHDPKNLKQLKCPFLRVLQNVHALKPRIPMSDTQPAIPDNLQQPKPIMSSIDPIPSNRNQVQKSNECTTSIDPAVFGNGLPPAHTFEQQFLAAHGRPIECSFLTPQVFLPAQSDTHNRVECTRLKDFFSALPEPPLVQRPAVPRTRIQARNLRVSGFGPDPGTCLADPCNPHRPVGW